jgi:hypothetical protein
MLAECVQRRKEQEEVARSRPAAARAYPLPLHKNKRARRGGTGKTRRLQRRIDELDEAAG